MPGYSRWNGQRTRRLQQLLDFFFMAKKLARDGMGRFTDIGQLDTPSMSQEQLGTVAFLEFFNLAGQRRLCDIQHLRGTREAAVRGDRVKRAQVSM